MASKLSPSMLSLLAWVQEQGRPSHFWLRTQARSNTITAALNRGLLRFFPYGDQGRGTYGITLEGAARLREQGE